MCTYGFVNTPERTKKMSFAVATEISGLRFLMRYPQEESRLLSPLRPFQPTVIRHHKYLCQLIKHSNMNPKVWCMFLVTLAILPITMSAVMYYQETIVEATHKLARINIPTFGRNCLFVINIITGQGIFLRT